MAARQMWYDTVIARITDQPWQVRQEAAWALAGRDEVAILLKLARHLAGLATPTAGTPPDGA